jgi:hypothetical protein
MLRAKLIRVSGRATTNAFFKIALKEIPLRNARNVLLVVPSLLILVAVTCAQNQAAGNPAVPPPSHPPVAVSPLVAPPPHAKEVHLKHILVISQTKGFEHDSIPDGMAAIYNMHSVITMQSLAWIADQLRIGFRRRLCSLSVLSFCGLVVAMQSALSASALSASPRDVFW